MGWVTIDGNHVFIKEHTTQGGRSAGDVRLHVVAQEAANRVPASKRFGDKVWISDVHEEYQKAGGQLPLEHFKDKLAQEPENRLRLNMARMDMPQGHDQAKIAASSAKFQIGSHVAAEWHFVHATGQAQPISAGAVAKARSGAQNPAAAGKAPQIAAETPTIGHTPGEKFGLLQRSATSSSKAAVNTGKGSTRFMFDMKKGDKPGQTSLLDRVGTEGTHPKPAAAAPAASAPQIPVNNKEARGYLKRYSDKQLQAIHDATTDTETKAHIGAMLNGVGYKGRRRLEESVLMARDQHIIDTVDLNHQTKAYEDDARRVFDAKAHAAAGGEKPAAAAAAPEAAATQRAIEHARDAAPKAKKQGRLF